MVRKTTRYSAIMGALLLTASALSACDEDSETPSDTASEQVEQQEAEEPVVEEEPEPVEPVDDEASEPAESEAEPEEDPAPDDETDMPSDLPDGFPDIGVPFPDHIELVATPSEGGPWVLEFVTDTELTFINNWIEEYFTDEIGWQGVNREVTGQQTVTTGTKDEYTLVIAVAPEPTDDFKTSLYYTLSTD